MAIVLPEAMDFSKQTFSMIIYGSPGVGKTTLALSAPSPVLIDFDRGISRVKARHRKATIMCDTYEEVLSDVKSPEMKDFETIVIDTGGAFITYLKDWALRTKPGCRQKNGDFNSMKGFGVVKTEFASFTDYIKTVLNKNVVYVFHSVEQSDRDGNAQQRLMCEGSVRNTVWNPCDFGGYVQMVGNQRVICFTPEEEYFAKGTHGIEGRIPVPTLSDDMPNDFVAQLFNRARASIVAENDDFAPKKAQYDAVMEQVRTIISGVTDNVSASDAAMQLVHLEHALTSKREASALLKARTDSLGLKYSKEAGGYIHKED